jgi:hypothetical protein
MPISKAPTIFPVLFAAIAGSSMKSIALWRVQTRQGATIGLVQQCLGSQTISSAFLTQVRLRAINTFAIFSVILWCLSPLGSQASLRVISIVDDYLEVPMNMSTVNTFSEYQYGYSEGVGEAGTRISSPVAAAISAASLLGSRNQDLWGNIRFPMMENLETSSDEWVDLPHTSNLTYSSLVGTPVGTLPSSGNISFTLPGSYLSISCPDFGTSQTSEFFNWISRTPPNGNHCDWASSKTSNEQFKIAISRQCTGSRMNTTTHNARKLIWESSTFNNNTDWTWAACDLTTTYVDANMTCTGSSSGSSLLSTCKLSAARRSPNYQFHTNWTVFDIIGNGNYNFSGPNSDADGVLSILTGLYPRLLPTAGIEPVLAYLINPYHAVGLGESQETMKTYAIGRRVFQTRLAQLLNSILYIGIDPTVFTGSWDLSHIVTNEHAFNFTAINSHQYQVVRCSRPWLGVLIVSSLTIFICALIGATLRIITLAPDILSPITAVFLHNKTTGVVGSSTWSSDEWARNLSDTKIYLGDIEPGAEIGCIALATSTRNVQAISSTGRYYL